MIAIIPERVIGMPGTLIGIVRNPQIYKPSRTIAFFRVVGQFEARIICAHYLLKT
jgi:hypothetical protein